MPAIIINIYPMLFICWSRQKCINEFYWCLCCSLDSEARKRTGPVKEEGCIVDRLLVDIRKGTKLRRIGSTRRSMRSHSTAHVTKSYSAL